MPKRPKGNDLVAENEPLPWEVELIVLTPPTAALLVGRSLSYWTSATFGPDDSICALVAGGRFEGDAGSGGRKAASGGAPWDNRRAAIAGSTITLAPTFTRS